MLSRYVNSNDGYTSSSSTDAYIRWEPHPYQIPNPQPSYSSSHPHLPTHSPPQRLYRCTKTGGPYFDLILLLNCIAVLTHALQYLRVLVSPYLLQIPSLPTSKHVSTFPPHQQQFRIPTPMTHLLSFAKTISHPPSPVLPICSRNLLFHNPHHPSSPQIRKKNPK